MMDADSKGAVARRPLAKRVWPLVLLIAGVAVFFALGLDSYLTFDSLRAHRAELQAWVGSNTGLAVLTYVVVYAVAIVAFPPSGAVMTPLATQ